MTDYIANIEESNFAGQIQGIAEAIFAVWLTNCEKQMDLPAGWRLKAVNLGLRDEFIELFAQALASFFEKTLAEQQSYTDGIYGYICRNIEVNLNMLWLTKYVIDNGNEHHNLLKLSALQEFLLDDPVCLKTFHNFYLNYAKTHPVTELFGVETSFDMINRKVNRDNSAEPTAEFAQRMYDHLSFLRLTRTHYLAGQFQYACCPSISDYLSKPALAQVLGEKTIRVVE